MQLLEGPEAAVRDCFTMIGRDPRHDGLKILMTGMYEERDFPEWTMGFEHPSDAWNLPPAWSTILEDSSANSRNPSRTKDLLLSFRHNPCGL